MTELIIREENELTEDILDSDLEKADMIIIVHTNDSNEPNIEELTKVIEKENKDLKIVYIHKYLSKKELTLGVKYNESIPRTETQKKLKKLIDSRKK